MAEDIVAAGGLLPDDMMLKVVASKLDLLHNKVGLVSVSSLLYLKEHFSTGYWTVSREQSGKESSWIVTYGMSALVRV